ncbi:MAG: hypothetical protein JXA93_06995 [Anaerolineae bacterium]|nr:hypothetical protein [Anaerolineae bacterium]
MHNRQGIWVLLTLAALAACTSSGPLPTVTSTPYLLAFNVSHISVEPSGKTHIELAVANRGTQELPADKFVAHFALTHADGTLRSASDTVLPRIPPSTGDLTTVVSINAPLEAGEYHASWGASGLGSTLVTFEIVARNGGLQLGKQDIAHFGPGHPYPTTSSGQ